MLRKRLGRKIAELRKEKGLTQARLAEKADYSVEFISLVERGINAPSVDGCQKIARILGVGMRDLFDF